MDNYYKLFLEKQKELNLLRSLKTIEQSKDNIITINNRPYIDFSSNDYLSLADHVYVKQKSIEFTEKYGTSASASRLLSGNFEYHVLLEDKIAQLKKKETGLIFGSGFIANTSVIPALMQRHDVIFADKLVHASIIDGIILAACKFYRYDHNDMTHLEMLLKKERSHYKNVLIITESVFSMDGDIAPVDQLVELKKKYNALLYIDEAHATGIFGQTGAGIVEQYGLSEEVDIIMGTFGKALGSYGAYLTLADDLKQYLINRARGFIFSTSLPPGVIGACLAAIELLEKEPERRAQLLQKSNDLRIKLKNAGLEVTGESQIIPVLLHDTAKVIEVSRKMLEAGFYILPIRPPTVREGMARIRLSIVYNHSAETLNKMLELLLKTV